MPDGVIACDTRGQIVYANRQAESLSGYRREEMIGRKVEMLVPAGLRSGHVQSRRRFAARPDPRPMGKPGTDYKLRRKDGTVIDVDIALGMAGARALAVMRDMSERRSREDELEHRALHDPLTGLANRNLFFDRLRQAIHTARREDGEVALVMLDLNDFKAVNDAFGHSVGDTVIREFGSRLTKGVRATDTAARIGGDEFAWILPKVSGPEAAMRIVHKRLAAAQQPVEAHGRRLEVGLSAGIAIYPEDGRDIDTLMRHADEAMYSAKRQGVPVAFHPARKRRD